MRKINEKDFLSFTVETRSFKLTVHKVADAVRYFNDWNGSATIYGNKPDGGRAILDSKN